MIVPDFKDFPRHGRIMGIDWGARRTGVAVSDETRNFVFTRSPIVTGRGDDAARVVANTVITERVVGIVIGLPLRIDGTESETTKSVRDFASRVAEYTQLPICFIDETLTSSAASQETRLHVPKEIKEKLDSESARIILENAIAVIKRS